MPVARRKGHHALGGVLSGIASAYNLDLRLLRIMVVLCAIFFPPTVVMYILAWILLPEAPSPGISPAGLFSGGSRNWLAIAAVFLAVLMFVDGPWGWGGGRRGNFMGAILLIGAGAWLWSHHGRHSGHHGPGRTWTNEPTTGPTPEASATTVGDATVGGVGLGSYGDWPMATGSVAEATGGTTTTTSTGNPWDEMYPWTTTLPASPPPPPPPPPPPVTRVTAAAALVALGLAFAGDRLGWYGLDAGAGCAVLLGVIGLGILAGSLIGGGRLLLLPALILLPLTIATARIGPIHLTGGIGDREVRPVTADAAAGGYHHGIGQLTVDLRDLKWTGDSLKVPVRLGIGQVRVWVPANARVQVNAHVGAGVISVAGSESNGTGVDESYDIGPPDAPRRLTLVVEDGVGHIDLPNATGAVKR